MRRAKLSENEQASFQELVARGLLTYELKMADVFSHGRCVTRAIQTEDRGFIRKRIQFNKIIFEERPDLRADICPCDLFLEVQNEKVSGQAIRDALRLTRRVSYLRALDIIRLISNCDGAFAWRASHKDTKDTWYDDYVRAGSYYKRKAGYASLESSLLPNVDPKSSRQPFDDALDRLSPNAIFLTHSCGILVFIARTPDVDLAVEVSSISSALAATVDPHILERIQGATRVRVHPHSYRKNPFADAS